MLCSILHQTRNCLSYLFITFCTDLFLKWQVPGRRLRFIFCCIFKNHKELFKEILIILFRLTISSKRKYMLRLMLINDIIVISLRRMRLPVLLRRTVNVGMMFKQHIAYAMIFWLYSYSCTRMAVSIPRFFSGNPNSRIHDFWISMFLLLLLYLIGTLLHFSRSCIIKLSDIF